MVTPKTRRPHSNNSPPSDVAAARDRPHREIPAAFGIRHAAHHFERGGGQEGVADAVRGKQVERRLAGEFLKAPRDERHAMVQRRHHHVDEAADPRPIGRRPDAIAGLRKQIMTHFDARQMAEQGAMRVQRPFRGTGGAGRVDDDGGIVGPRVDRRKYRRIAAERGIEIERIAAAVDRDDVFERRQCGAQGGELLCAGAIRQDDPGCGVGEAILQRLDPEQHEQGNRNRAELMGGDMAQRRFQ